MTIGEIQHILDAQIFSCYHMLHQEFFTACGSDLMSEVLHTVKDESVLLSGLDNLQLVRTAEVMDMSCVILVRGKAPSLELLSLAKEKEICIMSTQHSMFTACGLLYTNGLRGGNTYIE